MSSKVEQAESLLKGTGYDLDDLVFCYDPYSDEDIKFNATYYSTETPRPPHDIWPPREHPLLDLLDLDTLPDDPPEKGPHGWVRLTMRSILEENDDHTVVEIDEPDYNS